jgi:enamine deaminase RidA (YjgF/YER057c/UK114 family)
MKLLPEPSCEAEVRSAESLEGENMSEVRRIDPGPRLSEASIHGDRLYLSGMIPEDTLLDITGQVKQALAEIDALLKRGGSDKTKILSAVIWLSDIADFAALNAVWDAWVVAGQAPARATVQARLNDPNMKVEIMVVAAI